MDWEHVEDLVGYELAAGGGPPSRIGRSGRPLSSDVGLLNWEDVSDEVSFTSRLDSGTLLPCTSDVCGGAHVLAGQGGSAHCGWLVGS